MAVHDSEQLFAALEKSRLLNDEQFQAATETVTGLTEPTKIARQLVGKGFLSRWQAAQILGDKLPAYLGKYRLIDMLSSGDAGPIYLAEHEQMNRRVILKTVERRSNGEVAPAHQFLNEARTVATLDHRNVVHVFDVDKQDTTFYLVIEYVQGEDLQTIVEREGPLPFDVAAGYVAMAASGLAHAHGQDIQHHHVRPDQLIVDPKGELKVLNVGIAGLVERDLEAASRNLKNSKPEEVDYISPEQATGKNKVDHRADIYSLGCTLFYLLTGHPPYPEGTTEQRLKLRLRKNPPSVAEFRPDAPEELVTLCGEMMTTQPRERLASADEIAERLEAWLKEYEQSRPRAAAPRPKAAPAPDHAEEDAETSEADFGVTAAPELRLSGGKRKKRPKKTVAVVAETDDAALVEPESEEGLSPYVLYGSLGGGVALVLAIILAIVFWPSATEPVAKGDPKDSTPAATDGEGGATDGAAAPAPPEDDGLKPLAIISAQAASGVKFASQKDRSYLVSGTSPAKATYTIIAQCSFPEVTGFRLEALADESLPEAGSGRATDGRFVVSEVEVFAAPSNEYHAVHRRGFGGTESDVADAESPASGAIDRNLSTGWGPGTAKSARLDLGLEQTLKLADVSPGERSYWLKFVLYQQSGNQNVLGRFRLSAKTEGEPSGPAPPLNLSATPTVAHWRFDEGNAGAAVANLRDNQGAIGASDTSGNDNHFYASDAVAAPKFSGETPGELRSTGEANKTSLDTNPTGDAKGSRYVRTNATLANPKVDIGRIRLDQWTVEASMRLAKIAGRQILLCKEGRPTSGAESPFELAFDGTKKLLMLTAVDRGGVKRTAVSSSELPITAGVFYNIAAVCDGEHLKLMVDAPGDGQSFVLQESVPFPGGLVDSYGEWTVGRGFQNGASAGAGNALIDEVRISGAALADKDLLFHATPEQLASEKSPGTDTTSTPEIAATPIKFHPLKIDKASGGKGTKYEARPDGSYFVSGTSHDKITYDVESKSDVKNITGFRLELMADDNLPGGGPGRCTEDPKGRLALTNFAVEVAPKKDAAKWSTVKFKDARASVKSGEAKKAIDDDGNTGWEVSEKLGQNQWAVFKTAAPITQNGPAFFRVHLHHAKGKKTSIGRFRLAVMTGTKEEGGENPAARMLAEARRSDPFEKMTTALDLPVLVEGETPTEEMTDPFPLGSVYLAPDETLIASLLGGDTGHGARGSFIMHSGKSSPAEQHWEIRYRAGANDPEQPVAKIDLIGENAAFSWLPEAAKLGDSNFLRNCVLNFRAGQADHNVVLRVPVESAGIPFLMGKRKRKIQPYRAALQFPPDAESVQIQFKLNQDMFGDVKFDPENGMPANKGQIAIILGDTGTFRLHLVSSQSKGVVQLMMKPHFRLAGAEKDTPYSYERLLGTHRSNSQRREAAGLMLDERAKIEKKEEKKRNAKEKARLAQINAFFRGKPEGQVREAMAQFDKVLEQYNDLLRVGEQFNEDAAAVIDFRIYSAVGDTKVDLLRTTGWTE